MSCIPENLKNLPQDLQDLYNDAVEEEIIPEGVVGVDKFRNWLNIAQQLLDDTEVVPSLNYLENIGTMLKSLDSKRKKVSLINDKGDLISGVIEDSIPEDFSSLSYEGMTRAVRKALKDNGCINIVTVPDIVDGIVRKMAGLEAAVQETKEVQTVESSKDEEIKDNPTAMPVSENKDPEKIHTEYPAHIACAKTSVLGYFDVLQFINGYHDNEGNWHAGIGISTAKVLVGSREGNASWWRENFEWITDGDIASICNRMQDILDMESGKETIESLGYDLPAMNVIVAGYASSETAENSMDMDFIFEESYDVHQAMNTAPDLPISSLCPRDKLKTDTKTGSTQIREATLKTHTHMDANGKPFVQSTRAVNTRGFVTQRYQQDNKGEWINTETGTGSWEPNNPEQLEIFKAVNRQVAEQIKNSYNKIRVFPMTIGDKYSPMPKEYAEALQEIIAEYFGFEYELIEHAQFGKDGKIKWKAKGGYMLKSKDVVNNPRFSSKDLQDMSARNVREAVRNMKEVVEGINSESVNTELMGEKQYQMVKAFSQSQRKAVSSLYAKLFHDVVSRESQKAKDKALEQLRGMEDNMAEQEELLQDVEKRMRAIPDKSSEEFTKLKAERASIESNLYNLFKTVKASKKVHSMSNENIVKLLGAQTIHKQVKAEILRRVNLEESAFLIQELEDCVYDRELSALKETNPEEYYSRLLSEHGNTLSASLIESNRMLYRRMLEHIDALGVSTLNIIKDRYEYQVSDLFDTGTSEPALLENDESAVWDEIMELMDNDREDYDFEESAGEAYDLIKERSYEKKQNIISTYKSMTSKVRKAISTIPNRNDAGELLRDSMGRVVMCDPKYVHAILLNTLENCVNREERIAAIRELDANGNTWAKQFADMLEKPEEEGGFDDITKTQFNIRYHTDRVVYFVQRTQKDDSISAVVSAGKSVKNPAVENWQALYTAGERYAPVYGTDNAKQYTIDQLSIFSADGNVMSSESQFPDGSRKPGILEAVFKKASTLSYYVQEGVNASTAAEVKERLAALNRDKGFSKEEIAAFIAENPDAFFTKLAEVLLSLNVPGKLSSEHTEMGSAMLIDRLKELYFGRLKNNTHTGDKLYEDTEYSAAALRKGYALIDGLTRACKTITLNFKKGIKLTDTYNPTPFTGINSSQYNKIANYLETNEAMSRELSTTENGATYQTHILPGYLGELLKIIKGTGVKGGMTEKHLELRKYLEENFMGDVFFYNPVTKTWNLPILQQLWDSGISQDSALFNRAIVLHKDNKEYEEWSEAEDMSVLITQYRKGLSGNTMNSGDTVAYYAVPTLSDTATAEFVTLSRLNMNKHLNMMELDPDMNAFMRKGEAEFFEKAGQVALQEMYRIRRLWARAELIKAGKEAPVEGMDIEFKEDGTVKALNGAQFKFFPALNHLMYEGQSLLKIVTDYSQGSTLYTEEAIADLIGTALHNASISPNGKTVIDNMFNSYLDHMEKMKFINTVDKESSAFIDGSIKWSGNDEKIQEWVINTLTKLPVLDLNASINARGLLGKDRQKGTIKEVLEEVAKMQANNHVLRIDEVRAIYDTFYPLFTKLQQTIEAMPEGEARTAHLRNLDYARRGLADYMQSTLDLHDFYCNNMLAQATLIQLSATDIAFFGNAENFYKRIKSIHANGMPLDLEATWEGEKIWDSPEDACRNCLFLNDEEVFTSMQAFVKSATEWAKENDMMDSAEASYINTQWAKPTNATDGQSFISLKHFREIGISSGEHWSKEAEDVFKRIKAGETVMNASDFHTVWNSLKPMLMTNYLIDDGIGGKMRVPTQHKNSESILLAMYQMFRATPVARSPKLVALDRIMDKADIDVIHFRSVSKFGTHGSIDFSNKAVAAYYNKNKEKYDNMAEGYQQACENYLADSIGYSEDSNGNPSVNDSVRNQVIKRVSLRNYVIQTKVPPHHVDHNILFGTQTAKLCTSDLPDNIIVHSDNLMKNIMKLDDNFVIHSITKPGEPMVTAGDIKKQGGLTKQQAMNLYNAAKVENIYQMFYDLRKKYRNLNELQRLLKDTLKKSSRFDPELEYLFEIDPETNFFKHPFMDPTILSTVEQVLISTVKNSVVRQKIKGAALVQVSNFGLTEDLSVVFKDKKGNEISFSQWFSKLPATDKVDRDAAYKKFISMAQDNTKSGEWALAAYEAILPVTSEAAFKPFMNNDGTLDVGNMPPELREMIGYRIPTEAKYSIIPLRVKGFSNNFNGSMVMLPAEITLVTGSDFDIDKLYTMIPEMEVVSEYDLQRAWDDFWNNNPDLYEKAQQQRDDSYMESLKKFLEDRGYSVKGKIQLGKSQYDNAVQAFKRKYYSNKKLHKFLSKEDKQLFSEWFKNPAVRGKYAEKKKKVRKVEYNWEDGVEGNDYKARNNLIIDLIYAIQTNHQTAAQVMKPGGFDPHKKQAYIQRLASIHSKKTLLDLLKSNSIELKGTIRETLNSIPTKRLKELINQSDSGTSVLDAGTHSSAARRNMLGALTIGGYALHGVNHAVTQNLDLKLKEHVNIELFGHKCGKMSPMTDFYGNLISSYIGGYQAASVDNAKDPILIDLNQSFFTLNATMAMHRFGFNLEDMALLMTQPIIKEMNAIAENTVIMDPALFCSQYIQQYADMHGISSKEIQDFVMDKDTCFNDILEEDSFEGDDKKQFYIRQIQYAYKFHQFAWVGMDLKKIAVLTKTDTNNYFKTSIGSVYNSMMLAEANIGPGGYYLEALEGNVDNLHRLTAEDTSNPYEAKERILNGSMPYGEAMYTFGMGALPALTNDYIAHFHPYFQNILHAITATIPHGRMRDQLATKVCWEISSFMLTDIPILQSCKELKVARGVRHAEDTIEGYNNVRSYFLNKFPGRLYALVAQNEKWGFHLKSNKLLRDLFPRELKNCPVKILTLNNADRLEEEERKEYKLAWMQLYSNEHTRELAIDLVRYCLIRTGAGFGPYSFAHLIPRYVLDQIQGYNETLFSMVPQNAELEAALVSMKNVELCYEQIMLNKLEEYHIASPVSYKIQYIFSESDGEGGVRFKDHVVINADVAVAEKNRITRNKITGTDRYLESMLSEYAEDSPMREAATVVATEKFTVKPHMYIKVGKKGNYTYYKFNFRKSEKTRFQQFYYDKVEPLGVPFYVNEYDNTRSAAYVERVVGKDDDNGKDSDKKNKKSNKTDAKSSASTNPFASLFIGTQSSSQEASSAEATVPAGTVDANESSKVQNAVEMQGVVNELMSNSNDNILQDSQSDNGYPPLFKFFFENSQGMSLKTWVRSIMIKKLGMEITVTSEIPNLNSKGEIAGYSRVEEDIPEVTLITNALAYCSSFGDTGGRNDGDLEITRTLITVSASDSTSANTDLSKLRKEITDVYNVFHNYKQITDSTSNTVYKSTINNFDKYLDQYMDMLQKVINNKKSNNLC